MHLTGSMCNSCRSGSAVTQRRSVIADPRSSDDLRFLARLMQFPRVGVALRGRHAGMAKSLLDYSDMYSLLDQKRGGRMPGIVNSRVTDPRPT